MDPIYTLIIGIIMTLSGIGVFILGYLRRVPNTWLWASVPFVHGLHEFLDYWFDLWENLPVPKNVPFVVERFELLFAFASSFALLAAALEFNGVIARPNGKLSGLVGLSVIGFILFTLPADLVEDIHHVEFFSGIFITEPFRFFYGFILVFLSVIAILSTYLYLLRQSRKGTITLDKKTSRVTVLSIVLLLVYAFFEGFKPDIPAFVILRAVALGIFIIIPGYIVLTSNLGLQRFMVIDSSGILVYGYNFAKDVCIFCDDDGIKNLDENEDILTAGFLAALTSYSGEVLNVGKTFSIRANRLYFVISSTEEKIFVLQSIDYDKNLERAFNHLQKHIEPQTIDANQVSDDLNEKLTVDVKEAFSQFV